MRARLHLHPREAIAEVGDEVVVRAVPIGKKIPAPLDSNHSTADSSPRSPCLRQCTTRTYVRNSDGIRELEPAEYDEAARIITDAFLDDPGWRCRRARTAQAAAQGAARLSPRRGRGRSSARRADLRLLPGGRARRRRRHLRRRPLSAAGRTFVRYVPSFVRAGPGPIVRGLRAQPCRTRAIRPRSTTSCGGSPSIRRISAAGSAARSSARWRRTAPKRPCTSTPPTPTTSPTTPSFGFEEIGRAPLPRGATMWFMRRP